jgi:ATP-dependent protease ClpP protease subunit
MPHEIQAKGNQATIYVYGGIGMSDARGDFVDPEAFVAEVQALDASLIDVHLATVGGDPVAAGAMYQALVSHRAKVTTYNDSKAYSAGSMLLQAGDIRISRPMAMTMVHGPSVDVGVANVSMLEQAADALKAHAEMMVPAYTRHGIPEATVRGWIQSDRDIYFSAPEALAAGLIDAIQEDQAMANAPKGYRISAMADGVQPSAPVVSAPPPAPVQAQAQTPAEIVSAYTDASRQGQEVGARAEAARQKDIRALYTMRPFAAPQVRAVLDVCLADLKCDKTTAMDRALAAVEALPESQPINASAAPTAGGAPWAGTYSPPSSYGAPAMPGAPSAIASGIRTALEIRSGLITDREAIAKERTSEFMSMSLVDLMGRDLRAMGRPVGGTREDIARAYINALPVMAAGPSHGTSDLTGILADVANKSAMQGWDASEEVWPRWVQQGQLNDYKAATRANLALLDKLTKMAEHQEWEYGDMKDVKQSIQGYFHGLKYGLSIQAIVNDDLNELTRAFAAWGEAATATVGDTVHALLTVSNTTYGQTMDEDSIACFNAASHFNYASGAGAPSITTLGAARKAMMLQSDPNGRTVGIRPKFIITGPTLAPTVWTLTTSTTLIDGTATAAQGNLNWAQGLGLVPIEEYRMDSFFTTAWILAAARRTVEVSGVGGPLAPRVERSMISNIPGITYEMSMPFGAAILDWRGLYMHKGA